MKKIIFSIIVSLFSVGVSAQYFYKFDVRQTSGTTTYDTGDINEITFGESGGKKIMNVQKTQGGTDSYDVSDESNPVKLWYRAEPDMTHPATLDKYLEDALNIMGETRSYRDLVDRWFGAANTDIERWKTLTTGNEEASMSQYNMSTNNSKFSIDRVWSSIYHIINQTNEVIEHLEKSDLKTDNEIGALYAKALTDRAYFYYDLIRWFGDVPARFEYFVFPDDNIDIDAYYAALAVYNSVPKTDRQEIYDQIIADLKKAETYIGWAGEGNAVSNQYFEIDSDFPTKATIKAFRARISLAAAGYAQYPKTDPVTRKYTLENRVGSEALQCRVARVDATRRTALLTEARDACREVFEKYGTSKLTSDFEQIFKSTVGGNPDNEVLWTMTYQSEKDRYMGGRHLSGSAPFGFGTGRDFGGRYYVIPTFFFDFEEGDMRRDVTCLPFMWNSGTQTASKVNEFSFGKRRKEWLSAETPESGVTTTPSIVIRYADVLLMLAEAENELNGNTTMAQNALLSVRSRAFGGNTAKAMNIKGKAIGSLSKAEFFNAIVDERAFEFAGEQIRQADLIRWGMLKAKLDEAKANLVKLKEGTAPYDWVSQNVYTRTSTKPASIFISDYFAGKSVAIKALDFYGYNRGETTDPTGDGTGWTDQTSNAWGTDRSIISTSWYDYLYLNNPDERQLYPITTILTFENLIKDDYGYYTGY